MAMYDAIMVAGGGVRAGGELAEYVKRRFDLALERESGEPMVALSAGTTHRPAMLDDVGRHVVESVAGARYLMDRGISPRRIFCEATSYDTVGNGYFSRMQIAEPMGWRRILVITSEFHMMRTEAVFRWIYGIEPRVEYELEFAASPDVGLGETARSIRQQKELADLRVLDALKPRLTSLRALTSWIFTEHKAYTAVRPLPDAQGGDLLDSY
jgi:hypothetical protein